MNFFYIFFIIIITLSSQTKPDYSQTEKLLKKYIYKGYVAYGKWFKAKKDIQILNEEIKKLSDQSEKISEGEIDKSLLINLYNLSVISLILNHYPVASIMKIENAFKKKFIIYRNASYSLDELEKSILMKKYPDPRLHFALVCAALSCPYLQQFAYKSDNLDKTLDTVTSEFINNSNLNSFTGTVKISKIFDWYKHDFGGEKNLFAFLNRYLKSIQLGPDVEIGYNDYNWKLNGEVSLISNFSK